MKARLENKGEGRDYMEKSVEKLWRMKRLSAGI
jgi:hypothetical protein